MLKARTDQFFQAAIVSAQKTGLRRCNHLIAGGVAPVDDATGGQGQLTNEFPLRSSVAFSKRMNCIDFAEEKSRALDEGLLA